MEKKNYSEYHKIEYKGREYIFNPYLFGVGAWAESFRGKPGKYASKQLQTELNQFFFQRSDIPSLYERFKTASPEERKMLTDQSMGWLQLKIKALKGNSLDIPGLVSSSNHLFANGGLYFYLYDAKHKDDLPYWDRFPLVLLLEKRGNNFLGINLHYIPTEVRVAILSKLLTSSSVYNKKADILRVILSYQTLKRSFMMKFLYPGIKEYLVDHIQSKILPVESHEWIFAANIPAADFQKQNVSTVYRKYRKT